MTDLASNGAGTLGTGLSGAFANGATGISLRGLTVGATLVLVDGHRVAPYPLSVDSQRSFVDVSSIPFDAIESIEVEKGGASSLYGSDGIAGVVNINLKKSMTGTRFSAEGGTTQHGGGRTSRASFGTGFGDLDVDGYNAFATAEWRRQGAIKVSDRAQFMWDNRDWRSRGGNDLRLGVPTSLNGNLTAANSPFLYNPAGAGGINNPANYQFLDPSACNFTLYRAGGVHAGRQLQVDPAGSFFTFNAIDDPINCKGGKNTNAGSVVNGACGFNPPYVQITNKNLAPEKSTSHRGAQPDRDRGR